ncbi:hypothetical protein FRC10_007103 [Ceratobasidium sp. 414]|nr:hypothetical protein FRC10_007103 [Ceratobasidium sp. 414]
MGRNDTPVRFAGHSNSILEDYTRMTSPTMYRLVNDVFVRRSTHPRVIHVGWNPKGNLVLNFPANAPVPDIKAALPDITKALGLPEDMTYTRCAHWSKVALGRVPTGFINGEGARHSEAELLDELTRCNPHIAMLTITYGPRWITRDLARDKDQSTITFAFEDDVNGSALAALLKKPAFMGGQRLIVSKWNDRPILKGCTRCQDLGHWARECKSQPRCGICAGRHMTNEHRRSCTQCAKEKRAMNLTCVHPQKCANCGEDHRATDPNCPKRAAYRAPVSKVIRQTEETRADATEDPAC